MTTDATARRGLLGRLRAVLADSGSQRSWTLVANDGIVATAGILEGFAGAGATDRALLLAATVATVAGMLAAGGAKWSEAEAEREAQRRAAAQEAASLAAQPEAELDELIAYYEAKGLVPDLAREVAQQLTGHDAVAAQLESEHGILDVISPTDAILAGVGATIAYVIGAAIPLFITIVVPSAIETWAIFAAVIVSLVVTSIIGARTGNMDLGRTVARTLVVGIGTMAVSYAVGLVVF
jgi:VIT1/CCC1 family predicted Fe2+/Mn2+ transporter